VRHTSSTCSAFAWALLPVWAYAVAAGQTITVPFEVPSSPSVNANPLPCEAAPAFGEIRDDAQDLARISQLMDENRTVTLFVSQGERILTQRGMEIAKLWSAPQGANHASCTSKCVELPAGAELRQLTFTHRDSKSPCLSKPMPREPTPEIVDISCDKSAWRDILVTSTTDGHVLICATAASWQSRQPTHHFLLIELEPAM
jgi:hypothetical protein